MNINSIFEQAELAEAAYANFWDEDANEVITNVDDVKNALEASGLSKTQAFELVKHWRVVDHQPDTGSSFSATLFESLDNPGEFVFAIRGTAGLVDLVAADFTQIVTNGLAIDQIVDMYNYWQRLVAPKDSTVQQARLVQVDPTTTSPDELLVKKVLPVPGSPELLLTIEFENVANTGLGKITDTSALTSVTGHSLGGHLATAFTRLFSDVSAVTINGAGFATGALAGLGGTALLNIDNLFSLLGGANDFDASRNLNLFGDRGPEFVTQNGPGLFQMGGHEAIHLEKALSFEAVFGHGSSQVTDALAVYDLFINLDQRFQTGAVNEVLTAISSLLESLENQQTATYEEAINALGKLLAPGFSEILESEKDNREALYSRIQSIREAIFVNPDVPSSVLNSEFQGLTVTPLNELASEIKVKALGLSLDDPADAIAYRYALVNLNPFVITGNAAIYEPHNTPDANGIGALGLDNFSENYLTDAANFLVLKIELNQIDETSKQSRNIVSEIYQQFDDNGAIELELEISGRGQAPRPERFFQFGGDGVDELTGNTQVDHLYGNGGDDKLIGKSGGDLLEGGKGNDTLYSNDNVDPTSDDDDQDTLKGGAGLDTYYVGKGDVIDDSDRSATINAAGVNLNGTYYLLAGFGNNNEYLLHEDDRKISITVEDSLARVSVTNLLTFESVSFEIRNFRDPGGSFNDGDFGISLNGAPPVITYENLLEGTAGDDTPGDIASTDFNDEIRVFAGNDTANGGGGRDLLTGGDGDDALSGNADDDILQGDAGNDDLLGGDGDDLLSGGLDDDFINGGMGNDIADGGIGRDTLLGQEGSDRLLGGAGDDLLSGSLGDDYLDGGNDNDALAGGAGSDTLLGGAGNDVIWGDGTYVSGDRDWSVGITNSGDAQNMDVTLSGVSGDVTSTDDRADVVYGGAGHDLAFGGGGDDQIYGETGNDHLAGGLGKEELEVNFLKLAA